MDFLVSEILAHKAIANNTLAHSTSIHVAVIVLRNKILAVATNKVGGRSQGAGYSDYTIHAEKNVVKELGDTSKLRGASLYVFRVSRDKTKKGFDRVQGSEPCHDCHMFLKKCSKEYGLRRVFYSSSDFVELDLDCCPKKNPYFVKKK